MTEAEKIVHQIALDSWNGVIMEESRCVNAMQQHAIEFKQWCDTEAWKEDFYAQQTHTTEELYNLFNNKP